MTGLVKNQIVKQLARYFCHEVVQNDRDVRKICSAR